MCFIKENYLLALAIVVLGCGPKPDLRTKQLDAAHVSTMATAIEKSVTPQIEPGLKLTLWGVDSLIADPVSIDIDDQGRIYYTRTNRQKNSEFDIRGHQDWEIGSIQLSNIEEKRAFLHKVLAPELSTKNEWLIDLNKDGSHDWRDMTLQKEHIYRVEDTDGDGRADKSQLVVDDFSDEVTDAAGGILKHDDDLFVAIGPDLWRIKENRYGLAENKTSISHGYGIHIGFGGHGMSGIEVGPEGKIYWQIGDIGFSGVGQDGKKYEHPNSGVIVRSNADGSDFEVFAYGNRNTHEFVFDEYGNMISEDNDGDHPGEGERLVYVVDGADIGWRTNWQFGKYRDPDNNTYKVWMDEKLYVPRFEGQPAYILPTIRNFVNGPTGMLYNPGTAWNDAYKNTFFIVEFVGNPTRSGLHSFKLKPNGASFEFVESKMLLSGILATGIDWGPDGSMYLGDWIEGWGTKDYGRIWKLDVEDPDLVIRKETEQYIKADFKKYDLNQLQQLLRHADMRVRLKAQFELAKRENNGLKEFEKALAQTDHQLARVHAIWGISQFARKDISQAAILLPYLKDADPEIRAQAARWLGDVRYKEAGESLIPLLKDEYSRPRFFAAEALGRIGYEPAITPIIGLLLANNDVDNYIRHAGSLALARIGKPEPIIALSKHNSRAVRIAAVVALRRMKHEGIRAFLDDEDEFIVTEAARAINDDTSIPEALPDLARRLTASKFKNEAFVRRAISANLRMGTDETMQNLIAYSLDTSRPAAMRAEAIEALSTWAKPSVLDRVDGRFRGEITRELKTVQEKSTAGLVSLLSDKQNEVRKSAAQAIGKLQLASANDALLTRLKSDPSIEVKVTSLRALAKLHQSNLDQAISIALTDKEKQVRVAGLDLIGSANIEPGRKVDLLFMVIKTRSIEEKQTAVTALGTVPLQYSEPTFKFLLDQLEAGVLPVEIQFELSDVLEASKSQPLIDRLNKYVRSSGPDSLKALYAGALLGGDPRRGGELFWSHPTAQCVRCHSFDDYGGTAGPRINGVGKRLTSEQLLEALINPSARIAPGFGVVTLELGNRKMVSGILQSETTDGYVLKIGDKPDTVVDKTSVVRKIDSPSSMPPMQYLLTKKEIRDVISFLSRLTEEN